MSPRWFFVFASVGLLTATALGQSVPTQPYSNQQDRGLRHNAAPRTAPARQIPTITQQQFFAQQKAYLNQARAPRQSTKRTQQPGQLPQPGPKNIARIRLESQARARQPSASTQQYYENGVIQASYSAPLRRRQDWQDPFADTVPLRDPFSETPAQKNSFDDAQFKQELIGMQNGRISNDAPTQDQQDPFGDPPKKELPKKKDPNQDQKQQEPAKKQEPQKQKPENRETGESKPQQPDPFGDTPVKNTNKTPDDAPLQDPNPGIEPFADPPDAKQPSLQDLLNDPAIKPTQDPTKQDPFGEPPKQDPTKQDPFGDPPKKVPTKQDPADVPPIVPDSQNKPPEPEIKIVPPVVGPDKQPKPDPAKPNISQRPPAQNQVVPNPNRPATNQRQTQPPPIIQAPRQGGWPPSYPEPTYREPSYQQPVYNPQITQPPIHQDPAYDRPAYEDPVYDRPAYEDPVYDRPAYENPPVYNDPVHDAQPVFESPPVPPVEYFPPTKRPGFGAFAGRQNSNSTFGGIAGPVPFANCGTCAGFEQDTCYEPLYYFTFFGGKTDLDPLSSADAAGNAFGYEFDSGSLFGAAFGQRQGYNMRSEFEFAFRNQDFDSLSVGAGGPFTINGDLDSSAGMANMYWEFMSFPLPKWKPYIGAGLGFVIFDTTLNDVLVPFGPNDFDKSSFAYQFMAGVNHKLNSNTDLFVEYRYFNADDVRIESNLAPFGGSPNASASIDLHSDDLLFGIRLKF